MSQNRKRAIGFAFALALPFLACWVQWTFWLTTKPFVWFYFFPAIFFSSRIGGKYAGLAATAISALLADFFFIPPEFSFAIESSHHVYSVLIFLFMGVMFSFTHGHLEKTKLRMAKLQEDARLANEQLTLAKLHLLQEESEGRLRVALEAADLQAQVAILQSEERLRLVLDATGDGIWDWDMLSGEVYRSPRYYELTERDPKDDAHDIDFFISTVHPKDRAAALDCIQAVKKGAIDTIHLEYRLASSKDDKWIELSGRVVERDPSGAPLRLVGKLSNVTAYKLAEQQLREKEQLVIFQSRQAAMGDMINNIAHQWRQPLNILGFTIQELYICYGHDEFTKAYISADSAPCRPPIPIHLGHLFRFKPATYSD